MSLAARVRGIIHRMEGENEFIELTVFPAELSNYKGQTNLEILKDCDDIEDSITSDNAMYDILEKLNDGEEIQFIADLHMEMEYADSYWNGPDVEVYGYLENIQWQKVPAMEVENEFI